MTNTKKILVKCTLLVPVEVLSDLENLQFIIEENGCPGTGDLGRVIDREIERANKGSFCWACNFQGENKIIDYNYKEDDQH